MSELRGPVARAITGTHKALFTVIKTMFAIGGALIIGRGSGRLSRSRFRLFAKPKREISGRLKNPEN